MKITRREFIPAFAALLAGTSLAHAEESNKEQEVPQVKPDTPQEPDSDLIKALRLIDPNLSLLITNLIYCLTESMIFYKMNYEKLKNNTGNISEADLIHNTSDKWAIALSHTISSLIAYSVRFPFTVWIANGSSENPADVKRKGRILSDFMTINTFYTEATIHRYLTNAFQHELREAYKKILKEEPQYKCQPWAIPMSKAMQNIREIYPAVVSSVSQEFKAGTQKLKNITSDAHAIEWMQSRRNQLDLLLIFLSYIGTFVDIIPLVTANQIKAYTANTATGRMIGTLPANTIIARNILQRLKDKGDKEGYNEGKVIASANLYNLPLYWFINSSIQSFLDSALNLKEHSDSDVAYANLREITGTVIGSVIFMFLQYKLESSMRSGAKDDSVTRRSVFARFANWYIEPK